MRKFIIFFVAIIFGIAPSFAQGEVQGLKDVYKDLFKIGNILNSSTVNNQTLKNLVLREFNSITPENELKPDATMVQSGSTDNDIKVQLNAGARNILQFCVNNNIPLRGHTLVWHGQTPAWFFRANLTNSGDLADAATMDKRMESFMKNLFALIKQDYPTLNLYAYDVVNEAFNDDGTLRTAGTGSGQSPWTQIYGSDQFIINAFKFARKYAPSGCKLFYNDYNEYIAGKRTAMYNLAMKLKADNLIDGLGMQSHLDMGYPDANLYGQAVATFASTGLEVQITEFDITTSTGDFVAQGQKYRDIMQKILAYKDNVTAFVVWGLQDNLSWRSDRKPVLFDANGDRKPAYDELYYLASGTYPPPLPPTPDVEPDANGYYFYNTFEDGTTQSWAGRSAKVAISSNFAFEGTKSIFVSGRTATWNGTSLSLDTKTFKPGNTYSFGAMAMYPDGDATGTFKLTLQYNAGGSTYYDQVAQVPTVKGKWTELMNSNYTIPADATNLLLYVETTDLLVDFYVDRAFGGIKGKTGSTSIPIIQSGNSLKVWKTGNRLNLTGIAEGNSWQIYNLTGTLILQGVATSGITSTEISLPPGVYIVRSGNNSMKIVNTN